MRIVLVHATPVALEPVATAFHRGWPEAELVNLLDDSLSTDRARAGALTPQIAARIAALGDYALATGATAVLYTCSAFGPAIATVAARAPVPVLRPNEAMFSLALEAGRRIGMLATFEPSIPSMTEEFEEATREAGVAATLESLCVPEAMAALRRGDRGTHDRLLTEAAPGLAHCDAVMLAQFSTSWAAAAVSERLPCRVLTAPAAAVALLRERLEGAARE